MISISPHDIEGSIRYQLQRSYDGDLTHHVNGKSLQCLQFDGLHVVSFNQGFLGSDLEFADQLILLRDAKLQLGLHRRQTDCGCHTDSKQ